jgi:hypothetical protein
MALVPERTAETSEADREADHEAVVLLMPRFAGTIYARWLQPLVRREKRYIRVPLERRGSHLWRQIDGRRTVAELVADFVAAFPDDSEQAAERVCQYLYNLEQNRFIRFVNL